MYAQLKRALGCTTSLRRSSNFFWKMIKPISGLIYSRNASTKKASMRCSNPSKNWAKATSRLFTRRNAWQIRWGLRSRPSQSRTPTALRTERKVWSMNWQYWENSIKNHIRMCWSCRQFMSRITRFMWCWSCWQARRCFSSSRKGRGTSAMMKSRRSWEDCWVDWNISTKVEWCTATWSLKTSCCEENRLSQ